MKLPIIKSITEFGHEYSKDDLKKTVDVLEHISQARGLKDNELDVIGELISNIYGAVEVCELIDNRKPQREALNLFMQRVMGSIN